MKTIACRFWSKASPRFYVAQVKGDGGKDWGYTTKINDAIGLSPYWQRRFKNDCEHCNSTAQFLNITN